MSCQASPVSRRNEFVLLVLDCLIVLLASGFICFWDLGGRSFGVPDEVVEVQAGQEMFLSGRWWLPTLNGEPFFDKPPFKMWLSALPVSLFGASNFSYRFIDALAGVLTILLTYFFARRLFSSRLTGLISVLAFLGSEVYITYHGVRTAVQDSLLVFLSTVVMYAGWRVVAPVLESGKRRLELVSFPQDGRSIFWGVLGGIACGFAVFSKSAGGLLPILVLALFCILSGNLWKILRLRWQAIAITLFLSLLIPSFYFVTHCIFTEDACRGLLYHHVYGRIRHGYHDVAGPWFYMIRIFVERGTVPPFLLAAGVFYGLYQWLRRADYRYGFLVVWALAPVVLYSIPKTKLSWYIAPAFPAMAILVGLAVVAVWVVFRSQLSAWWNDGVSLGVRGVGAGILLMYSFGAIGVHLHGVVSDVMAPKKTIPLDPLVASILKESRENRARVVLYSLATGDFALEEKPYVNMLAPLVKTVSERSRLEELLKAGEIDFLVLPATDFVDLHAIRPVTAYAFMSPLRDRERWIALLAYGENKELNGFTPWKQITDFGSREVRSLYGLEKPDAFGDLRIRWSLGPKSALLVPGDWALIRLGAEVYLNFAPHLKNVQEEVVVDIYLNERKVTELRPRANRLDTYRFIIPKGVFRAGDNALGFVLRFPGGREVTEAERLLMFNWVSMRLAQYESGDDD